MDKTKYKQVYRKCKKLAAELGCEIQIERMAEGRDRWMNYWVYGPTDVYYVYDLTSDEFLGRNDPCDGEHCAASWCEVWDKLETYQEDLFFHHLSVSSDDTGDILRACVGEGSKLLEDWMAGWNDSAHILADWLEDHGHTKLANIIRGLWK